MKTKQTIAVVLALCMTSAIFTGCSSKANQEGSVTTASGGDTTPTTEMEMQNLDKLPSIDYKGETITILCRDDKVYEVFSDTESGEIINDAVFKRNQKVEEKYNVKIGYKSAPGMWEDAGSFQNLVKNTVLADDKAYDLVAGYMAYTIGLGAEGYFHNLYNVPTLDMKNPWWVKGFIDNNTVFDSIYFGIGDISLTMWENIYAIFFNKQLISDYGMENPYDLVKSGKWTIDKLDEMSRMVSKDLNGDGAYDDKDLYGLITNTHSLRAILTSFDIPVAERNSDGTYKLVYYTDKTVSAFEKMYTIANGNTSSYVLPPNIEHAGSANLAPMFIEDRALFMTFTLTITELLRDMKNDFGILPFPKYDEAQETYLSHSYDGLSIFGIPISAKNPEMSGAVLEALCAESAQSVIPAFYDTKLKNKITRDNDSAEMLDIIRENLLFDFAYCHTMSIEYIFSPFGDLISTKDNNFVSNYEKKAKVYEKSLTKLIEKYESIQP